MRRLVVVGSWVVVWGAIALPSCREATQLTLDIHTNVGCGLVTGTAISGGSPGRVEQAPPKLTSRSCDEGRIGTLVVSPESSDDARVALRVVMGVGVPVEACTPATNYKGCIVSRRELAYVAHASLELPIDLLLECLDVPCDEHSTCAATGQCVSAEIRSPEDCTPPHRCYPVGDPGPRTPIEDAAPSQDASFERNGIEEGGSSIDAAPDASDASGVSSVGAVDCGEVKCSRGAGLACCVAIGGQKRCSNSCSQPPIEVAALCDSRDDCPTDQYCCSNSPPQFAACSSFNSCTTFLAEFLCHSLADCPLTGFRACDPWLGPFAGSYSHCVP